MKIKNNITVYQCDHCNKKLFRKHAMINHEVKCPQNPLNIRACFDCSMCERVGAKYEPTIQTYEGEPELIRTHTFKCLVKNVFMYPPKLEHSEHGVPEYVLHDRTEIIQEKMPLNCEVKKSMGDDIDEFFN